MSDMVNKFLLMALAMTYMPVGVSLAQIAREDQHFINPQYSKRISLDFKDASLSDVLKVFSKQSGSNFIASDSVGNKRITLMLSNIPIEEALQQILSANNLEYTSEPDSNLFVVKPKSNENEKIATHIYPLKHASVSVSKLRKTLKISQGSGASGVFDVDGGITSAVRAVMSARGKLVEDARTNSFIISDLESQFPIIEATIANLDVEVPAILIEVEMLDISKNTSELMGAKFGDTIFSFQGSSKTSILPFDQTAALATGKTTLIPDSSSSSSSSSSSATSPYTAGKLDFTSLTAVIQFLKTQTDTRNLARPRILTLNNETAEIKVSANEAIGVSTQNFSQTSSTSSSVTAERANTGVFLTVTPQADVITREIVLALNPRVIQSRKGGTFDNHTFNDVEERGTESILKIHDGDTIIIGGLLRTDDQKTVTKIPILGDIPIIGMMFRHKDKAAVKRELIIFLTPHILDDDNQGRLVVPNKVTKRNWSSIDDAFRKNEIEESLSTMEQKRF